MEGVFSGCMVCGAPLEYLGGARSMECAVCHRRFESDAVCVRGHFVCDSCHSGATGVTDACLASTSRDPTAIAMVLMRLPGVHMHGPEHHVIVGSALITAYRNAGGDVDLPVALEEMSRRGKQVPGGVCGNWGACGAALSCGTAYSIIRGTTPLSGESWGRANLMTSRCLEAVGSIGGPRCCKRDTLTALRAAAGFLREEGADIVTAERAVCIWYCSNPQCLGKRCPYHPDNDGT